MKTVTGIVVTGFAAMLLCACAPTPPRADSSPPPAPPPPTADQQFEALVQRYLKEAPEQSPVSATALGDHRFDDRLDDVSVAGWQARLKFTELYLAEFEPLDRTRLSRANQVDALLLLHDLQYDRWKFQTLQDWRWNPLLYTRIAGDGLYNLLAREFAPAPERLKNLGKRLDELPRFLAQVREVLEPARVPKVHAETAAKQNAGLKSMLEGEITAQLAALPADEQSSLRASIAKARTAVSQHQIWLDKRLTPEAKGNFRLGADLYDQKLSYALFSPLSREEIRARAESELAATRAAMYEIAATVLKNKRGEVPRRLRNPAPRNSSGPSRQLSSSPTRNVRNATRCSTPRAPRWSMPRSSCATRTS